jgi:hypothetical protein
VVSAKRGTQWSLRADENDPSTDTSLMGDRAKVSSTVFEGHDWVELILESGESAGTYRCQNGR